MSLRAIRWALEQRVGSASAKVVLLVLAEAADRDDVAAVRQRRIAEVTELALRTVNSALEDLREMGLIERTTKFGAGGGRETDDYLLTIGAPVAPIKHATIAPLIPATVAPLLSIGATTAPLVVSIPEVPTLTLSLELLTDTPPIGPPHVAETKKRSRRCPASFQPDEVHRRIATDLGVDFDLELAKFRDHDFDRPKSDWASTLRNWLRNEHTKKLSNGNGVHLRSSDLRPDPEPAKTRMQLEHERRLRAAGV